MNFFGKVCCSSCIALLAELEGTHETILARKLYLRKCIVLDMLIKKLKLRSPFF